MSVFNEWELERYKQDAFARFTATRDLDLGTARALMWVSQLVYELDTLSSQVSVDKVKKVLQRWDMQLVDIVAIPGLSPIAIRALPLLSLVTRSALVISGRGAIIVAFAGTDPPRLQDWLVNFAALPAPMGVSKGFGGVAQAFVPSLKQLLDRRSDLKLFVTGHSLGGALGVAVASELGQSTSGNGTPREAEAVYTFGMPRAGDASFAADYDRRLGTRTYRFVHGEDLVPTVPPAALVGLQHQHVGWLIRCKRGAKFALDQKSPNTQSNEPVRDDDIVKGAVEPTGWVARGWAAWSKFTGGADPVQIAIESLPPRIRQHLQDQYIVALTP